MQTWVVVMGVKVAPQRAGGCASAPASSSRHRSVSSAAHARAGGAHTCSVVTLQWVGPRFCSGWDPLQWVSAVGILQWVGPHSQRTTQTASSASAYTCQVHVTRHPLFTAITADQSVATAAGTQFDPYAACKVDGTDGIGMAYVESVQLI